MQLGSCHGRQLKSCHSIPPVSPRSPLEWKQAGFPSMIGYIPVCSRRGLATARLSSAPDDDDDFDL